MELPVNTLLQGGKYRIIRFINSGGFGCTYEAVHVMLDKRVAIKEFFVKDFCNRDESTAHVTVGTISKKGLVEKLRNKFIDEAKSLCQLHHPGIVSVSDVFNENGTAYFVMDYIEGKSINDMLKDEGAMPEKRAVRYICQIVDALKCVHKNNRLHLDIKPSNIMIDSNDNPVLIDFGASKQYDEEAGENTSTLIGKTPGFAPPEQMSNCVMTFMPATDIYALGATLYKMLTGITPLEANLRISGEELEPLPANVSQATCEAVYASMQINKNKRPQSLDDFLRILNAPVIAEDGGNKDEDLDSGKDDESTELANNDLGKEESKKTADDSSDTSSKTPPAPDKKTPSEPKKKLKWPIIGLCVFVVLLLLSLILFWPTTSESDTSDGWDDDDEYEEYISDDDYYDGSMDSVASDDYYDVDSVAVYDDYYE